MRPPYLRRRIAASSLAPTVVASIGLSSLLFAGCAGGLWSGGPRQLGVMSDRPWVIVRSPHFELWTDGDVEGARGWLDALERFRLVCRVMMDAPLGDGRPPLRLVAPTDIGRYETLRPDERDVVGYYRTTRHGGVAVFSLRRRARDMSPVRVALHEYVHHLQAQSGRALPLWFREGLAEYLSAFRIESPKTVRVGGVQRGRAVDLLGRRRTSYRQLVSEPEAVPPQALYAQSWLLVHFLVTEHARGLDAYLAGYPERSDAAAFEAAFGFPLDELHQRMERYLARGVLNALQLDVPAPAFAVRVQPVSAAERDYLLAHLGVGRLPAGRLEALFVPPAPDASTADAPAADAPAVDARAADARAADARAADARAADAGAEAPPGPPTSPGPGLAHLALAEERLFVLDDPEGALQLVDRILPRRPDDARVLTLKARILLRTAASRSPVQARSRVEESVRLASRANRLDPTNVEAFELLVKGGKWTGQLDEAGLETALRSALALAPFRDDLLYEYVGFLVRYRDPGEARRYGEVLLRRTKSPELRRLTRELLSELE